ncbi:YHS domain-containing (seleno)protein [Methylobrevis albus]|uniref:YHS domain protein n=1 Tax=Methylobrevis albus TaxID=2793297 RepID=A0A931I3R9_9HYPH|nr:YHS domain-containing (seleno)protein [Methylobrevis albus]MBH0239322.1 hypothetical protein [Methylobrevis albus]
MMRNRADRRRRARGGVALGLGMIAGLLGLVGAPGPARALSDAVVHDIYTGLAISGFDPVSYFTDGAPQIGQARFEVEHAGVFWRFVNEGNLAAFLAAPAIYMPAYGGYSALSVAAGVPAAGIPEIFAIRNDRLFLFASEAQRTEWLQDPEIYVFDADRNWPELERGLAH